MSRIDTSRIITFVTNEKSFRDGVLEGRIGKSMGLKGLSTHLVSAIPSIINTADPFPAAMEWNQCYFRQESLFVSHTDKYAALLSISKEVCNAT